MLRSRNDSFTTAGVALIPAIVRPLAWFNVAMETDVVVCRRRVAALVLPNPEIGTQGYQFWIPFQASLDLPLKFQDPTKRYCAYIIFSTYFYYIEAL